jgi:hypothetical protein
MQDEFDETSWWEWEPFLVIHSPLCPEKDYELCLIQVTCGQVEGRAPT